MTNIQRNNAIPLYMSEASHSFSFHDKIMRNLPVNLEKIMNKIEYSREHGQRYKPTEEALASWISRQHTPYRRQACQAFVDHSHYYTFYEAVTMLNEQITKALRDIQSSPRKDAPVCIFLPVEKGENVGQSSILFGLYGYHVLTTHMSPEQIRFINNKDLEQMNHTKTLSSVNILLIDDFSYSGSQLKTSIQQLYFLYKDTIHLSVCLVGCSDRAKNSIFVKPRAKTRYGVLYYRPPQYLSDNYKLYTGIVVPTMYNLYKENKLDKETYIFMEYFFRPFNGSLKVSVFFEHKMADDLSTLSSILRYGAIIPAGYKVTGSGSGNPEWVRHMDVIQKEYDFVDRITSDMSPEEAYRLEYIPILPECSAMDVPYLRKIQSYYSIVISCDLNIDQSKHIAHLVKIYKERHGTLDTLDETQLYDLMVERYKQEKKENGESSDDVPDEENVLDYWDNVNNLLFDDIFFKPRRSTEYYYKTYTPVQFFNDIETIEKMRKQRCPVSFYKHPDFFQMGGRKQIRRRKVTNRKYGKYGKHRKQQTSRLRKSRKSRKSQKLHTPYTLKYKMKK